MSKKSILTPAAWENIVRLFESGKKSWSELADMYGTTPNALSVRYNRGLTKDQKKIRKLKTKITILELEIKERDKIIEKLKTQDQKKVKRCKNCGNFYSSAHPLLCDNCVDTKDYLTEKMKKKKELDVENIEDGY